MLPSLNKMSYTASKWKWVSPMLYCMEEESHWRWPLLLCPCEGHAETNVQRTLLWWSSKNTCNHFNATCPLRDSFNFGTSPLRRGDRKTSPNIRRGTISKPLSSGKWIFKRREICQKTVKLPSKTPHVFVMFVFVGKNLSAWRKRFWLVGWYVPFCLFGRFSVIKRNIRRMHAVVTLHCDIQYMGVMILMAWF